MPLWMEILINVIGYAGFVVVATFNKSSDKMLMAGAPGDGRLS
jgi:hypothetical protein